ncbi:hypothetical protein PHLCEN_2v4846 [Hermanssonia centrifuga]|uniref:Peptidase C14 caspase domain-containing protein n=1 Tax=Hermanssonia centrifuga TaxID=98765 RepID=A0A2R6PG77_9APHY|nr:hypothetical protein PHLCEN_2v4846 [Hermanssonia centrifuga]
MTHFSFIIARISELSYRLLFWILRMPSDVSPKFVVGVSPSKSQDFNNLFALLIGINDYTFEGSKLQEAVDDANNVKEYLTGTLDVPLRNIRVLLDQEASRADIIKEIRNLKVNNDIAKDDPILIYFAGHGTTAPYEGSGHHTVELILPCDYGKDENGRIVNGILDLTVSALLAELAETKGNNITIILDCCHAGSGTRADDGYLIRTVEGTIPVPRDLDEDIHSSVWHCGHRAIQTPSGFRSKGLNSHVLLAACGSQETALEKRYTGGLFTRALLVALKSVHPRATTYEDLMNKLRLPKIENFKQNPQCEGFYRRRLLFSTKESVLKSVPIYRIGDEDKEYKMDVGVAAGSIAEGDRFELYSDHPQSVISKSSPAILIAKKPNTFFTLLEIQSPTSPTDLPLKGFAVQTLSAIGDAAVLLVCIAEESLREDIRQHIAKSTDWRRNIQLVDQKTAELEIHTETDKVIFNLVPAELTCSLLRASSSSADICDVIYAARAYHYHWRRQGPSNNQLLCDKVDIKLVQVVEDTDTADDNLRYPYKVASCHKSRELRDGQSVKVQFNDKIYYGLEITNKSQIPLYCSVFFFDSDLSIKLRYQPGTSGQTVDAPLQPKKPLEIGYGSSGVTPWQYVAPPHSLSETDVGYLKVFLSTHAVDLSHMAQASPVEPQARHERSAQPTIPDLWGIVTIPVHQRNIKDCLPS